MKKSYKLLNNSSVLQAEFFAITQTLNQISSQSIKIDIDSQGTKTKIVE